MFCKLSDYGLLVQTSLLKKDCLQSKSRLVLGQKRNVLKILKDVSLSKELCLALGQYQSLEKSKMIR